MSAMDTHTKQELDDDDEKSTPIGIVKSDSPLKLKITVAFKQLCETEMPPGPCGLRQVFHVQQFLEDRQLFSCQVASGCVKIVCATNLDFPLVQDFWGSNLVAAAESIDALFDTPQLRSPTRPTYTILRPASGVQSMHLEVKKLSFSKDAKGGRSKLGSCLILNARGAVYCLSLATHGLHRGPVGQHPPQAGGL